MAKKYVEDGTSCQRRKKTQSSKSPQLRSPNEKKHSHLSLRIKIRVSTSLRRGLDIKVQVSKTSTTIGSTPQGSPAAYPSRNPVAPLTQSHTRRKNYGTGIIFKEFFNSVRICEQVARSLRDYDVLGSASPRGLSAVPPTGAPPHTLLETLSPLPHIAHMRKKKCGTETTGA